MSTRKKKKTKNTRQRGNRLTKLAMGALALGGLTALPTVNSEHQNYNGNNFSSINQDQALSALTTGSNDYNFNTGALTFTNPGGITTMPTYDTSPFAFPEPNTSVSKVSAGMNLNPEKNYSVTVKSTNNPSFGVAGNLDPLSHHTLEVQEVDENNTLVGNPAHVGYYAKATPASVAKYQGSSSPRPKLNNNRAADIFNPLGTDGHWQTPDAIVESASAKGKSKLTTVGKPKIVSGKVFNEQLGQHVNLDTMGKYSAPSGLLKGAIQSMAGNEAANKICGAGNCRTEAHDMISKFGGRRTKRRRKSKRNKTKKTKNKLKKSKTRKKKKKRKTRNRYLKGGMLGFYQNVHEPRLPSQREDRSRQNDWPEECDETKSRNIFYSPRVSENQDWETCRKELEKTYGLIQESSESPFFKAVRNTMPEIREPCGSPCTAGRCKTVAGTDLKLLNPGNSEIWPPESPSEPERDKRIFGEKFCTSPNDYSLWEKHSRRNLQDINIDARPNRNPFEYKYLDGEHEGEDKLVLHDP
tara:strand:- start:519 stop:2093 length:1575 start_codon:yes stop_codon:yes gene_type:complete